MRTRTFDSATKVVRLTLISLLTGCANRTQPTSSTRSSEETPGLADIEPVTVVSPLHSLVQQRKQSENELHDAAEKLKANWMRDLDHTYTPEQRTDLDEFPRVLSETYGDIVNAQSNGFCFEQSNSGPESPRGYIRPDQLENSTIDLINKSVDTLASNEQGKALDSRWDAHMVATGHNRKNHDEYKTEAETGFQKAKLS